MIQLHFPVIFFALRMQTVPVHKVKNIGMITFMQSPVFGEDVLLSSVDSFSSVFSFVFSLTDKLFSLVSGTNKEKLVVVSACTHIFAEKSKNIVRKNKSCSFLFMLAPNIN